MQKIGLNVEEGIRFRQHKAKEMAHYASDCWDCELLTSYGWVECVGLADRSAYDLECHSKGIGKPIVAARQLDEARPEERIKIILNKGVLGRKFKSDMKLINAHMDQMDAAQKKAFKETIEAGEAYELTSGGKDFTLAPDDVTKFQVKNVMVKEEKFTPAIIEPAFGFGRVMFALLEHSFHLRDEKRTFLNLRPEVAPIKCSILPLMQKPELVKFVKQID